MRSRMRVLALSLLAGCATAASAPGTEPHRGLYSAGFERSSFRPCGLDEAWWVIGAAGLDQRYREVAGREYEPVFVVLRGAVGPEGRYGHMGAYPRELTVHEVVQLRPARQGDCD